MLFIAYVGICLKVHKNVLKCSLGDYLYPPSTLFRYVFLTENRAHCRKRRRYRTALLRQLFLTEKWAFYPSATEKL